MSRDNMRLKYSFYLQVYHGRRKENNSLKYLVAPIVPEATGGGRLLYVIYRTLTVNKQAPCLARRAGRLTRIRVHYFLTCHKFIIKDIRFKIMFNYFSYSPFFFNIENLMNAVI